MSKRALHLILIIVVLLPVSGIRGSLHASQETNLLQRRIGPTQTTGQTIDQLLATISAQYQIPIGMDLADANQKDCEINLDLPETNLKSFLDSVVNKDPRYNWTLGNGVIHISPVKGRDSLLAKLLETRLTHFAFAEGATRYRIKSDILEIPEIKTQLISAGVEPMILPKSSMISLGDGVALNETNLTLSDLLDKIILKGDVKSWTLARWGANNEYIVLRF